VLTIADLYLAQLHAHLQIQHSIVFVHSDQLAVDDLLIHIREKVFDVRFMFGPLLGRDQHGDIAQAHFLGSVLERVHYFGVGLFDDRVDVDHEGAGGVFLALALYQLFPF